MKVVLDKEVIFEGSLKECVEEITQDSSVVKEVRQFIKSRGSCPITLGTTEYTIVK